MVKNRNIAPKNALAFLGAFFNQICNPTGTMITLIEPYRFSTPFPFASTLTRKRSSNLSRK